MKINSPIFYFASGIGAFLLGWFLPVKFPNLPAWFSTAGIIVGVVLVIIGIVPWVLRWLRKSKSYPLAPIVVEPKKHDSFLKFDKASISISEEHPNPFLLQIQNIGEADIVNATIKFEVVGLNLQELLSDSPAFPFTETNPKGGIWITTKKYKNGRDSQYSSVDFVTTGERVVRLLSARGKPEEIDMPEPVKRAISLFMIASSYRSDDLVNDKIMEKIVSTHPDDKSGWAEILAAQRDRSIIEMPDIAMHASWSGSNQKVVTQTVMLKSVYLSLGGGDWVNDTTSGESFRYIQMGILSFENRNEPEQGNYNQRKNRILEAAKK